jgi:bis(5'-adenosyl)-triphosphatase
VLVCPLAPRQRLLDLTPEETTDLFATVKRVQRMLARRYFVALPEAPAEAAPAAAAASEAAPAPAPPELRDGSFNVAIQDGPDAGQTVPHMHVHILPRPTGSTAGAPPGTQGNAVYEDMTVEAGNLGGALWDREVGKRPVPGGAYPQLDELARRPRTMEEMEAEAAEYRRVLDEMAREEGQ